jgi:hypothetical protein
LEHWLTVLAHSRHWLNVAQSGHSNVCKIAATCRARLKSLSRGGLGIKKRPHRGRFLMVRSRTGALNSHFTRISAEFSGKIPAEGLTKRPFEA